MRPALLAACLLGLGGPAMAQAPDSMSRDALRYVAQVTVGDNLKAMIRQYAAPDQRLRIDRANIEFAEPPMDQAHLCHFPTRLAYSASADQGYRITICFKNLRILDFILREGLGLMMAPTTMTDGPAFGRYFSRVAGYLHQQRRTDILSVALPCSSRYFLFLVDARQPESKCMDGSEAGDAAFRTWLTERNNLVNSDMVQALQSSPFFSGLDAEQVVARMRTFYTTGGLTVNLIFAVAHEYGHVALGHLDGGDSSGCALVREEQAADDFAFGFMRTLGAQNRSDISSLHLPWFLLGMAARETGGQEAADSTELAAVRLRFMLRALQTEGLQRAQEIPQPVIRNMLEFGARNPLLQRAVEEIERSLRCE